MGQITVEKYDTLKITFNVSNSTSWDNGVLVSSSAIYKELANNSSVTVSAQPTFSETIYLIDRSEEACPKFAEVKLIVNEPVSSGTITCGAMEYNSMKVHYSFNEAHDAVIFTNNEPTPYYFGRIHGKSSASGSMVENSAEKKAFTYKLYDNATKSSKLLAQKTCNHPGSQEVYFAPQSPTNSSTEDKESTDSKNEEKLAKDNEQHEEANEVIQNTSVEDSTLEKESKQSSDLQKKIVIGGGTITGTAAILFTLANLGVQLPFGLSSFLKFN